MVAMLTGNNSLTKVFRTPQGKVYAYDGLSSRIYSIPASPLDGLSEKETEEIVVKWLLRRGIIHQGGFEYAQWNRKQYSSRHQHRLTRLILQLTRACNLDCCYCVYSGHFPQYFPHAQDTMSEDTIQQSIDFFLEHSSPDPDQELCISFYGGEPLLYFERIRFAVSYAVRRAGGHRLLFQISSNGTILTPEITAWLAENPTVSVIITLNGSTHDLYRVTRNGAGSCRWILDGLHTLRQKYSNVWEKQVRFIANVGSVLELPALRKFYKDALDAIPVKITTISTYGADATLSNLIPTEQNTYRILKEETDAYTWHEDPFFRAWLGPILSMIHERPILDENRCAYVPSCTPGDSRLFVRTDGSFNLCEKVSDGGCFGCLKNGFDEKKVDFLCQQMEELVGRTCLNCWAQRLCLLCFNSMMEPDGQLTNHIPETFCRNSCQRISYSLKLYCDLIDQDSHLHYKF